MCRSAWVQRTVARCLVKTSGLAYLSLFVADLAKSKAFYGELLGLPLVNDEEWGVTVQAGAVQVMLHPAEEGAAPQNVELQTAGSHLLGAFNRGRPAPFSLVASSSRS